MDGREPSVVWKERILSLERRFNVIDNQQEELYRMVEEKEQRLRNDLEALEDASLGKFQVLVDFLRRESASRGTVSQASAHTAASHLYIPFKGEDIRKISSGKLGDIRSEQIWPGQKLESPARAFVAPQPSGDPFPPVWAKKFSKALFHERRARLELASRLETVETALQALLNATGKRGLLARCNAPSDHQQDSENRDLRANRTDMHIQAYISRVIRRIERSLAGTGTFRTMIG
jgi:hypothetical protein